MSLLGWQSTVWVQQVRNLLYAFIFTVEENVNAAFCFRLHSQTQFWTHGLHTHRTVCSQGHQWKKIAEIIWTQYLSITSFVANVLVRWEKKWLDREKQMCDMHDQYKRSACDLQLSSLVHQEHRLQLCLHGYGCQTQLQKVNFSWYINSFWYRTSLGCSFINKLNLIWRSVFLFPHQRSVKNQTKKSALNEVFIIFNVRWEGI